MDTAAFDNLQELSSIARTENMWFHVDGAYGSLIILDPQRRYLVKGIDQADSLAFDFHKWLHCPYDAGCVMIRDFKYLEASFAVKQAYLSKPEQDPSNKKHWCFNLGLETSRSFRALKVWFLLKEHGIVKLGEKIAENCEQIQYLLSLLEKYEHIIRIIRPVSLNIINFRFEPQEFDKNNDELIDHFNNQLLADIHASGFGFPSSTRIKDRFYIRLCNVNHRSVREDFNIFVNTLLKLYENRLQAFLKESE